MLTVENASPRVMIRIPMDVLQRAPDIAYLHTNFRRWLTQDPNRARLQLVNVEGVTRTRGSELLLGYRWQDIRVTGSYVYTDARDPSEEGAGRRPVSLTPRHSAGLVAMWEQHDRGRIGLEAYYTGVQALDDNPWRRCSRPSLEVGALGEIVLGKVSLFLNLENTLSVRQSGYNSILRAPSRRRWPVDRGCLGTTGSTCGERWFEDEVLAGDVLVGLWPARQARGVKRGITQVPTWNGLQCSVSPRCSRAISSPSA